MLARGEADGYDFILDFELLERGNNDLSTGGEDCAVDFEDHCCSQTQKASTTAGR